MLQDILKSWQEYREEERRLSKWLAEKEGQIEEMKHIDLGDIEVVRKGLKMVIVSGPLHTTFQSGLLLVPLVQGVDSNIHWINHYSMGFCSTCPVDSDLSSGQHDPSFEQRGPGARFSKVPKLFGRISGDIILFVSSK